VSSFLNDWKKHNVIQYVRTAEKGTFSHKGTDTHISQILQVHCIKKITQIKRLSVGLLNKSV